MSLGIDSVPGAVQNVLGNVELCHTPEEMTTGKELVAVVWLRDIAVVNRDEEVLYYLLLKFAERQLQFPANAYQYLLATRRLPILCLYQSWMN
jgi:hypothetical protein